MDSVCVLIATKDRRPLLDKALQSVLKQSVLPNEIIIVNDGSADDTAEYLKKMSSLHSIIKFFNFSECRGVNFARNYGLRQTKASWVVILDDDDILVPEAVFLVKQNIQEIPDNYYLFYFNTLIKKDGQELNGGFKFNNNQKYYDPSYEDVMTKFGLSGDCKVVLRRSLFDDSKYFFPESVNGFESVTFRLIAKDGKKSRYYNNISTVVNLDSNFDHLSFSASAKNPKNYLHLQKEDLNNHVTFYQKNPKILKNKYREMSKLALRAHSYGDFFWYAGRSFFIY